MVNNTKNLTLTALCTALICVLAPISVPLPGGVPISLCNFAIMLAGAILGPQLGLVSVVVYLLLAAVGLPVLAGYSGGIAKFFSPSGGYLFGDFFLVTLTGYFYKRLTDDAAANAGESGSVTAKQKSIALFIGMLLGTAVLYIFGTAWFIFYMRHMGTPMTVGMAMGYCVLPFLPGDFLKMVAIVVILPYIERALRTSGFRTAAA